MKKIIPFILISFLLCSGTAYQSFGKNKTQKNISISEATEWSNTWMVSTNKHDLPRVLIIGDSHVERYYQVVAGKLSKKAYCCKFTTSRSLGDPALIAQLKALFFSYRFDVISFNNGLHGIDYSDEAYSRYLPIVYKLFKKSIPELKLIWVNITSRRVGGNLTEFDKYNSGVINRNMAIAEFTTKNNIPLIDFYLPSFNHPEYYENDGIHFNKTGVEEQAKAVSSEIMNVLGISGL